MSGYLFWYENSIDNLLKMNTEPQNLEGVVFTFNDDGAVERISQARSVYGEDSVIRLLDADDTFTQAL